MRDRLTKRDWEDISAYLDGQLSGRKQVRLESRLQHDQQLQIALEEMRITRDMLRNAPQLRAPRSFMLTPEMAGQPRRLPRLSPIFGWATAVASFLFVIFLVGDLFTPGGAIPMALNNFPQPQQEFVAPKGAAVETEDVAQPMMEMPAPEISEGETTLETAASPEETAPVAEQAASREVAPVETTEEPVVERPASEEPGEEAADVAAVTEAAPMQEGPDTAITFSAVPEEEPVDSEASEGANVDEIAGEEESHEPREGEGNLVPLTSITDTLPTETATIDEQDALLAEEAIRATEELQPAAKAAPTDIPTQPIADFEADESAVPEPNQEGGWGFAMDETEKFVFKDILKFIIKPFEGSFRIKQMQIGHMFNDKFCTKLIKNTKHSWIVIAYP